MWPLIAMMAGQAIVNYMQSRSQAHAAERAAGQQVEGVREARAYAEPLYAWGPR